MARRCVCPECARTVSLPPGYRKDHLRCPACDATIPLDDAAPAPGLSAGVLIGSSVGAVVLLAGLITGVVLLTRLVPEVNVPEVPVVAPLTRLRTVEVANRNVWGVAFTSDGQRLLTGDGYFGPPGSVRLWQTTGAPVATLFDAQADVLGTAIGPEDRLAAWVDRNGLHLFDLTTKQKLVTRAHPTHTRGVAFAPDGTALASCCEQAVRVWSLPAAEQRWSRPLSGKLQPWRIPLRLGYAPDSRTVAVGDGNDALVLDATTGDVTATAPGHREPVLTTAFSPDGNLLATGSMDHSIRLWNPRDGKPIRTVAECPNWLFSVAFAPNGKVIAAACRDGTVGLWNLEGKHLATAQAHEREANNVVFAPDGTTLATSGVDGKVCLWDVAQWAAR